MDSPYDRGKRESTIEMVRMLQGLLYMRVSDKADLRKMALAELQELIKSLQEKLRDKTS